VQVEGAVISEQFVNQGQPLVEHREVRVVPASPRVAIGVLLEDGRLLDKLGVADLYLD